MEKLKTYLLDGKEVPEGTAGAVLYETDPIAPETGLYAGGMTKGSSNYRTALFVDGGKVQENQSVTAAINGGSYDGKGITGGVIDSDNQYFNGVMVNDTDFTVKNLTMTADGSGGNDFKGFGAGVAGYGKDQAGCGRLCIRGRRCGAPWRICRRQPLRGQPHCECEKLLYQGQRFQV